MTLSSLFEQLNAEGPRVEWPKVLFGQTASLFSALYAFGLTERLSPAHLEQLQNSQLERLLKHAATHVPYYGDVLRRARFKPGATPVGDIWTTLPILTRADLRTHAAKLRAQACPKSHGALRHRSTSGSTSQPVSVTTTELTDFFWTCVNLRDRAWHGIDLGATLVLLADGGKELGHRRVIERASWSLAPSALARLGKQFQINPMLTVADQALEIAKLKPTYIQTRPSQLNLLVKHCMARGTRFDGLRAVFCISEIVTDGLRHACRQSLGVEIIENYSCAETGYLALQCPETGKLHVQSELVRLEVLDTVGEPCPPGEVGRVVVTSLHNYAMPLIRYEIGDEAEVGAPCSCGRGLPVIEKVIGRTQDCLILPTGDPIRINTYHYRIAAMPKIREFQIVQRTTHDLEIKLVADARLDLSETQRLTDLLANQGEHRFNVEIVYCDTIERTASGKLRSFVSEVETSAYTG